MESEKRKRVSDGEAPASGRRVKGREGAAVKVEVPADDEVEEFFAILRRIQVAVKYFQGRELAAPPTWNPSFEREDFDEQLKKPEGNRYPGLDLNSDPPISDDGSRDFSDSV